MAILNHFKADAWEAADKLRANSKLTDTEYYIPVLGLIFLRHATNRFMKVKAEIEETEEMQPADEIYLEYELDYVFGAELRAVREVLEKLDPKHVWVISTNC